MDRPIDSHGLFEVVQSIADSGGRAECLLGQVPPVRLVNEGYHHYCVDGKFEFSNARYII